jgi:hypothetical protein
MKIYNAYLLTKWEELEDEKGHYLGRTAGSETLVLVLASEAKEWECLLDPAIHTCRQLASGVPYKVVRS